jgi:hypothetical protein
MDVGVFAQLGAEASVIPKLVFAIEDAVVRSFEGRHGMIIVPGTASNAEQKRRVNLCLDIVKVLRGDMKWSWTRIADHVAEYLNKKLDDNDWEPSARSAWAPQQ